VREIICLHQLSHPSIYPSIIYPCIHPSIHLSISIYPSIHPSILIHLLIHLSIYPFILPSIHPCTPSHALHPMHSIPYQASWPPSTIAVYQSELLPACDSARVVYTNKGDNTPGKGKIACNPSGGGAGWSLEDVLNTKVHLQ
jgi:hypothetical protein